MAWNYFHIGSLFMSDNNKTHSKLLGNNPENFKNKCDNGTHWYIDSILMTSLKKDWFSHLLLTKIMTS